MNVVVKGAIAAGALLIIAAGLRAGLRENGATPRPSPSAAGQKRTASPIPSTPHTAGPLRPP
jgi:molybdate transport system substrate-binding protein